MTLIKSDKFAKEYYFSSSRLSFESAQKYCDDLGFKLLKLESMEQQTYVQTTVAKGSHLWLGAKAPRNTHTFSQWLDGSEITFSNWFHGQPDCSSSCCAAWLDTDKTWMDTVRVHCMLKQCFINYS